MAAVENPLGFIFSKNLLILSSILGLLFLACCSKDCVSSLQKLKDVAFPRAEDLKKELLQRYMKDYAKYTEQKVSDRRLLSVLL